MAEELSDPTEHGLWISASAEANGKGERMQIPSTHVGPVLDALRTAAAGRADYALNVAILKWQELPRDLPGLIDYHDVERVLTMVESAAEALRVLREVAGEVVDPDA